MNLAAAAKPRRQMFSESTGIAIPASGVMPHQRKVVTIRQMLAMVVGGLDDGGNQVLMLPTVIAVAIAGRWCRIRNSKPIVRQPIDGMICRFVVAIHVARRRRVGISDLCRGGCDNARCSPDIRSAAVWNIISGDVGGIADIAIT